MLAIPRAARRATNVHFFLNGLAFATWGVHVPTCKRLHGLSEAEVALAVLAADVDFLRPGESLLRRLCGCAAGAGRREGAERLERASTHWMRHSHASHAIAAGMPIEIAQQNLGHASLSMTTVYVTTESKRRMKAVERFWRK